MNIKLLAAVAVFVGMVTAVLINLQHVSAECPDDAEVLYTVWKQPVCARRVTK